MIEFVTNSSEVLYEKLLGKQEPFVTRDMAKELDIGIKSVSKHIKILVDSNKLFVQRIGQKHYFINRELLNLGEVLKINERECVYLFNDEVSKKMCTLYCTHTDECRTYVTKFQESK